MDKPKIAAKASAKIILEPGKYLWCRCGLSKSQPFCDDSHIGTGFEPLEFEVKVKGQVSLCQCKYTKRPPFCDDTHLTLPDDAE